MRYRLKAVNHSGMSRHRNYFANRGAQHEHVDKERSEIDPITLLVFQPIDKTPGLE
jgi:hypothetical protein